MNPSMRKYVETPDGRRFAGRWPQSMPETGEGPYIAALARAVGGACEVSLPVGRADVANNTTVFEVEPSRSWRLGARQALAYSAQCGLAPALAIFGTADYLPIYIFVRDRIPGMALWIYRGKWVKTGSRRDAALKHWPHHDDVPAPASDDFERQRAEQRRAEEQGPMARFFREVPAEVTDPVQRARQAGFAMKAHMARLSMKSAQKRAKPGRRAT